jgi:SAM-dependent methyltransferase
VLRDEYQLMHGLELKHWWFRGRRRILVDLLEEATNPGPPAPRILDYGCGTGGNTSFYAALGSVVGIEPDWSAIRLAHVRGGANYCRSEGTRLPFRPGVFDIVVASDVLEHIEDDEAAVAEIARVIRPGGVLILTVPAHQWMFSEHDVALHHFRRYSKTSLRMLLEGTGMKIRRLSYWNASLFPLICLLRLMRAGHSRPVARSDRGGEAPHWINEGLAALLAGEAAVVRRVSLPWGVSLVAAAQRM